MNRIFGRISTTSFYKNYATIINANKAIWIHRIKISTVPTAMLAGSMYKVNRDAYNENEIKYNSLDRKHGNDEICDMNSRNTNFRKYFATPIWCIISSSVVMTPIFLISPIIIGGSVTFIGTLLYLDAKAKYKNDNIVRKSLFVASDVWPNVLIVSGYLVGIVCISVGIAAITS